ncbi:MAG: hypothetical protein IJJ96_07705 [Bacteroidales bacterium]|nr:hypothetical protein [Bacteroidales bacterium]
MRQFLFFFMAASCMITSCDLLSIDSTTDQIYMYCILNQGTTQELHIDGVVSEIEKITLFCENNPVGYFVNIGPGEWSLDYTPEEGRKYTIKIDIVGQKTIRAETRFPGSISYKEITGIVDNNNLKTSFTGFDIKSNDDLILWCSFVRQNEGSSFLDYIWSDHPGIAEYAKIAKTHERKEIVKNSLLIRPNWGCVNPWVTQPESCNLIFDKALRISHPNYLCRVFDNKKVKLNDGVPATNSSMFLIGGFGIPNSSIIDEGFLQIDVVSKEYDKYLKNYFNEIAISGQNVKNTLPQNYKCNVNVKHAKGVFGAAYTIRKEAVYAVWDGI